MKVEPAFADRVRQSNSGGASYGGRRVEPAFAEATADGEWRC